MESLAPEIRIQLRAQQLTETQKTVLGGLGIRCVDQKEQSVIHAYVEPVEVHGAWGFVVAESPGEDVDPPFGCTS